MKYLIFIVFLLFPLFSSAQISLGFTTGVNMGKFGGIEPGGASYTSRTGLNFGGSLVYRFNEDISIALQPLYSQRGSNIEVGEDSYWDTLKVYEAKIDFLIIPLFIRVDSDNGMVYFSSGVEFGIPLSSEISRDENVRDISNALNNIDILASIGLGLRFTIGKPELLIEFRYYQGLVDFNSGNEIDYGNIIFENFKNNGFQLMAGLEWKL